MKKMPVMMMRKMVVPPMRSLAGYFILNSISVECCGLCEVCKSCLLIY